MNTSLLNLSSQAGGSVLGYTGTPAAGNLYFALSPASTTDGFGNTVATGITVQAGSISGVSIVGAVIDSTSNMVGTSIQQGQVLQPTVTGGTATSLVHVLNNGNGQVLGYVTGSNASTFATNGSYLWTAPTGVTAVRVQTWGAGGGAGGGNVNEGGEGGGGGEYAEEPSYAVVPGQVYRVVVGKGGQGGVSGQPGYAGGTTSFQALNGNTSPVVSNPGQGGAGFIGGNGGTGSQNTIHFNGGNGASASGQTGGNGGGSSAGPTAQGNAGLQSSSGTGGGGGSAVSGGGAGGAGGNSAVAGVNGSAPGAGGGGNGNSSGSVISQAYTPNNGTYSYYGPDAETKAANQLRNHDGPMFQGLYGPASNSNYAGTQLSYMTLPYTQIQSQLVNATITHVTFTFKCLGAYYSTGVFAVINYSNVGTFGNTVPSNDTFTQIAVALIKPGQTQTVNFGTGNGLAASLQNGNALSIKFYSANGGLPGYGYFDSGANGGVVPTLTVYYYIGSTAPIQAGNGADGKVVISYGNAPTSPTLNLAISSVSTTDPYGNSFAAGFTGPQLTLANNSTAPTSNTGATAINANTAGTVTVTNSQGFTGQMASNQVDTSHITLSNPTTNTAVTKAYSIPSGDAQVGTIYRITAWGDIITANPPQSPVFWVYAFGNTLATAVFSGAGTSVTYEWYLTGLVQVTATGGSGVANAWLSGTMNGFTGAGGSINQTSGFAIAGAASGSAVNTTTAQVIELQMDFRGSGSNTAHSFGSILERLGP